MPRLFFYRNRKWILTACVFTLILIVLSSPAISGFFKKITVNIVTFPSAVLSGAGDCLKGKNELLRENASLKEQNSTLSLRLQQFSELEDENRRLRGLLGLKKDIRFDTVSAEIIARDPNDWTGSFIIDRGRADGIRKNSSVCSSEGLIGKVAEVDEDTSSVMLLTNPAFKTGAMLEGSRLNGILVGEGSGKARLLYIPMDADVQEGEAVVTSGFSRISPKGIVIGKVSSVGKSPTGLYKFAVIEPAADPLSQEVVLCVK